MLDSDYTSSDENENPCGGGGFFGRKKKKPSYSVLYSSEDSDENSLSYYSSADDVDISADSDDQIPDVVEKKSKKIRAKTSKRSKTSGDHDDSFLRLFNPDGEIAILQTCWESLPNIKINVSTGEATLSEFENDKSEVIRQHKLLNNELSYGLNHVGKGSSSKDAGVKSCTNVFRITEKEFEQLFLGIQPNPDLLPVVHKWIVNRQLSREISCLTFQIESVRSTFPFPVAIVCVAEKKCNKHFSNTSNSKEEKKKEPTETTLIYNQIYDRRAKGKPLEVGKCDGNVLAVIYPSSSTQFAGSGGGGSVKGPPSGSNCVSSMVSVLTHTKNMLMATLDISSAAKELMYMSKDWVNMRKGELCEALIVAAVEGNLLRSANGKEIMEVDDRIMQTLKTIHDFIKNPDVDTMEFPPKSKKWYYRNLSASVMEKFFNWIKSWSTNFPNICGLSFQLIPLSSTGDWNCFDSSTKHTVEATIKITSI